LVSRTDAGLVKKLFELEVPEIYAKTVEIKGLVREAGSRSKMAVHTADDSIDPIGSCVGQKGTRVQTVKAELGGENIDIIVWDEDPAKYITNALSPAKIKQVKLDTEKKEALVAVEEDQLSLAIGKSGQNVRLAAKLTGWKIDIVKEEESEKDKKAESKEAGADTKKKKLETKNKDAAKKEADTDSKNTEKSADKATKKKKK
jgi:transcription termination/antitermination protein NusA